MSQLLSIDQLAEYLGVDKQVIYRMRYYRGGPRAFRAGRVLRWRQEDVDQWIENELEAADRARKAAS